MESLLDLIMEGPARTWRCEECGEYFCAARSRHVGLQRVVKGVFQHRRSDGAWCGPVKFVGEGDLRGNPS